MLANYSPEEFMKWTESLLNKHYEAGMDSPLTVCQHELVDAETCLKTAKQLHERSMESQRMNTQYLRERDLVLKSLEQILKNCLGLIQKEMKSGKISRKGWNRILQPLTNFKK